MSQLRMIKNMDSVLDYPMPEGYGIRKITETEAEIADWVEICQNGLLKPAQGREYYDLRITNFQDHHWIHAKDDVFLVYDRSTDRNVATITAFVMPDGRGDIHMVAARPECTGKKIGHAMLSRALKELQSRGVKETQLTTDDWRLPAIKTYLTAGFRPVLFEDSGERWAAIFEKLKVEPVPFVDTEGRPVSPD